MNAGAGRAVNFVRPFSAPICVDVSLDSEPDWIRGRGTASDSPRIRVLGRHAGEDRLFVLNVGLDRIRTVVVFPWDSRLNGLGIVHDLACDGEALGAAEHRAILDLDQDVLLSGRGERHVVLVRRKGRIACGDGLVGRVKYQNTRVVAGGRGDGELDDDRLAGVGEVAEADVYRVARGHFEIHVLDPDLNLRLVDDGNIELAVLGGPAAHVLVAHLHPDFVGARIREAVAEARGIDPRAGRNDCHRRLRACVIGVRGVVMADNAVGDVLAVLLDRPLVDEAVVKVVADVVELRLNRLRLALRVLVRERIAVAVGLEAVQVQLEERRVLVVDRDVDEVGRRIPLDAVRRIERLAGAEHDAERVGRAAVILAYAVEHHERALGLGADGSDLDALASRSDRVEIGDDRLRARAAERAGRGFFVVVEERVDVARRRVAERDLVVHHRAFDVLGRIVGHLGGGGLGGRHRDLEGRDGAPELANRRVDLDRRRDVAGRRRIRDRRRGVGSVHALEEPALAARRVVDRHGHLGRLSARLDTDLVARRNVGHVGVGVVDRHGDLELLARRHRVDRVVAADRRGDDRGIRVDVDAGLLEVGDLGGRHFGGVDLGEELHLLARADSVGGLCAKRIDVDILLVVGRGERHYGRDRRGQRFGGVVGREANVVPPVRLGRVDLEDGIDRDVDVGLRWQSGFNGKARDGGEILVVAGSLRDHGRVVARDLNRSRLRLNAFYRNSNVIQEKIFGYGGEGVARICT